MNLMTTVLQKSEVKHLHGLKQRRTLKTSVQEVVVLKWVPPSCKKTAVERLWTKLASRHLLFWKSHLRRSSSRMHCRICLASYCWNVLASIKEGITSADTRFLYGWSPVRRQLSSRSQGIGIRHTNQWKRLKYKKMYFLANLMTMVFWYLLK